jgi:hypothetical protein
MVRTINNCKYIINVSVNATIIPPAPKGVDCLHPIDLLTRGFYGRKFSMKERNYIEKKKVITGFTHHGNIYRLANCMYIKAKYIYAPYEKFNG